jgi:hypothetical protein
MPYVPDNKPFTIHDLMLLVEPLEPDSKPIFWLEDEYGQLQCMRLDQVANVGAPHFFFVKTKGN